MARIKSRVKPDAYRLLRRAAFPSEGAAAGDGAMSRPSGPALMAQVDELFHDDLVRMGGGRGRVGEQTPSPPRAADEVWIGTGPPCSCMRRLAAPAGGE